MNQTNDPKRTLISVCIATYNRQKLLKNLLNSLLIQKNDGSFNYEIIIVDNNSEGNAKSVVSEFNDNSEIIIKYFIQPVKNISLARNTALENASGELIAFIDDDETADENWLNNLYKCLTRYNADGVFGYVVPRFEEGVSNKYKRRGYYFSEMGESGSNARFFFTTNVLFKYELIKNYKVKFNPDFGITGGEDAEFFGRLKKEGAKFVNCKEAVSYEFIGKERTTMRFFLRRNIRGGQTYARNFVKDANIFQKVKLSMKALLKLLIGIILFIPGLITLSAKIKSITLLGSGIGEILGFIGKPKAIH